MIQKIKNTLIALGVVFSLAIPALVPAAALAATATAPDINNNLCSGANLDLTGGSKDCAAGADQGTFQKKLGSIVNIISIIVGVVAVIMIIFGGFKYITSGGASEKVTSAKNTILYGLIGLIIVALAQIIVKFVLNQTTST